MLKFPSFPRKVIAIPAVFSWPFFIFMKFIYFFKVEVRWLQRLNACFACGWTEFDSQHCMVPWTLMNSPWALPCMIKKKKDHWDKMIDNSISVYTFSMKNYCTITSSKYQQLSVPLSQANSSSPILPHLLFPLVNSIPLSKSKGLLSLDNAIFFTLCLYVQHVNHIICHLSLIP